MPVIFLILHLNVPSTLNKGINVFEIRVETLLFKPMDKLTCYPVITPLKDPMRNLIGSFLSLLPPPPSSSFILITRTKRSRQALSVENLILACIAIIFQKISISLLLPSSSNCEIVPNIKISK